MVQALWLHFGDHVESSILIYNCGCKQQIHLDPIRSIPRPGVHTAVLAWIGVMVSRLWVSRARALNLLWSIETAVSHRKNTRSTLTMTSMLNCPFTITAQLVHRSILRISMWTKITHDITVHHVCAICPGLLWHHTHTHTHTHTHYPRPALCVCAGLGD